MTVSIWRDLSTLPEALRGGAMAIGNFDGVHRGHAQIVARLLDQARVAGGPAVVFTFDPHPVRLLRPLEAPPPLTWTDRKVELLAELGVDAVFVYPTDERLLRLSAREFFDSIVCQRFAARALVEGPNFYFGHGREGNVERLAQWCPPAGVRLEVVNPVLVDGQPVSSSRVRVAIAAGQVDAAARMLTAPYRVRGMVIHGVGRGAKLGFPTANLAGIDTLLPGPGVYAGRARLSGASWPAAINVGANPTFDEEASKVEVHVIGLSEPLYGRTLEVDFLQRLRETVKFASLEALREQLRRDVSSAESIARRRDPAAPDCP